MATDSLWQGSASSGAWPRRRKGRVAPSSKCVQPPPQGVGGPRSGGVQQLGPGKKKTGWTTRQPKQAKTVQSGCRQTNVAPRYHHLRPRHGGVFFAPNDTPKLGQSPGRNRSTQETNYRRSPLHLVKTLHQQQPPRCAHPRQLSENPIGRSERRSILAAHPRCSGPLLPICPRFAGGFFWGGARLTDETWAKSAARSVLSRPHRKDASAIGQKCPWKPRKEAGQ